MYRKKRFFAKVIDYVFVIALLNVLVLTLLNFVPSLNESPLTLMSIVIVLMLSVYFIYYGVLGSKLFNGSLGKSIMKVYVTRKDNKPTTMIGLALREPFMLMFLMNLVSFMICFGGYVNATSKEDAYMVALFVVVPVLILGMLRILFIVLFFTKKDFWNNKYNVEHLSLEKVITSELKNN